MKKKIKTNIRIYPLFCANGAFAIQFLLICVYACYFFQSHLFHSSSTATEVSIMPSWLHPVIDIVSWILESSVFMIKTGQCRCCRWLQQATVCYNGHTGNLSMAGDDSMERMFRSHHTTCTPCMIPWAIHGQPNNIEHIEFGEDIRYFLRSIEVIVALSLMRSCAVSLSLSHSHTRSLTVYGICWMPKQKCDRRRAGENTRAQNICIHCNRFACIQLSLFDYFFFLSSLSAKTHTIDHIRLMYLYFSLIFFLFSFYFQLFHSIFLSDRSECNPCLMRLLFVNETECCGFMLVVFFCLCNIMKCIAISMTVET